MIRATAAALILIAVLAGAGGAYYWWYEPGARYGVRGIDVSHHQGVIDWPSVAASGVRFAYIKATEGGDWVDRQFQRNWQAAGAAGLARGAYHFFTFCRPWREQAANILRTVPKESGGLPLAIDLEFTGNCARRPAPAALVADVTALLGLLESHYGQRPILYVTRDFHDAYLLGQLRSERFWLRSLARPPRYAGRDWLFWQYHNKGRRDGVKTLVDLNVFNGLESDFATLLKP